METLPQSTRLWLSKHVSTDFQITKHAYSHQDEVYKVKTPKEVFYLKISSHLIAERDNLRNMAPYAHVPRVIGFAHLEGKDHLLISEVPGKNLAELTSEWEDTAIVEEFANAVRHFHALDANTLFPNTSAPGLVVLHGDMALPNIICAGPGVISYIDLGQMTVGPADRDLADAIWSLQRNLGPGYGERFLHAYGPFEMTEKIDKALKFNYSAQTFPGAQ